MTLRRQPGFSFVIPEHVVVLEEADFAEFERVAGVSIGPEHRNDVQAAVERFTDDGLLWPIAPTAQGGSSELETGLRLIANLAAWIEPLAAERTPLAEAVASLLRRHSLAGPDLSGLLVALASAGESIRRALQEMSTGNAPPGSPRQTLVLRLREIFHAAGGVGEISNFGGTLSGPLFEFLRAVLARVGENVSDTAIRHDLYTKKSKGGQKTM